MSFSGTRHPDFRNIGALDYDEYWRTRGFAINEKLKEREQIALAHIPKGSSVFDIGCGNSLLPLALRDKGCSVTVGDVSAIVLEGFEKEGLKTERIDLDQIGRAILSGTYDYIIMSEVLEHTRNPEEVIEKLKPHARRFILSIPNSAFYRFRLHLFFNGRFFTQWVAHPSEHLRFWSHIDFVDWIRDQGLVLESSVASNGLSISNLKNVWPNLFGHQIVYIVRCP